MTQITKYKTLLKSVVKNLFIGSILFAGTSCEKDSVIELLTPNSLSVSVSADSIELTQKKANSNALIFNWTTGSNKQTGAAISYTLQIDQKGNNFIKAISYDMGKATYSKQFTNEQLNNLLTNVLMLSSGVSYDFEARVIANTLAEEVKPDTSAVISFSIKPYKPVTSTLYIVGSATPIGWSINMAIELVPDTNNPTIFRYQGPLGKGQFKLPVNRNSDWAQDMYMKTSDTTMYLHIGGQPDDNSWENTEEGIYAIEVDLLNLTIKKTMLPGPAYSVLYIIGSATPKGWGIDTPDEVKQNPKNLFQFRYNGPLYAGDFKFPTKTGTYDQDMYMNAGEDKIYLHKNGTPGDDKWTITNNGFYQILLDLSTNSITYNMISKLYMVGSATPNGWDISLATELLQDPSNPFKFTYTGTLNAGEMKFPLNRNTDWGQDMFMNAGNGKMYLHNGGDSDDNKWNILEAGNYKVELNLVDLTATVTKQ